MKKILSALLAVLLLFVSGQYVLLEGIKNFLQTEEQTPLKSQELAENEEDEQEDTSKEETEEAETKEEETATDEEDAADDELEEETEVAPEERAREIEDEGREEAPAVPEKQAPKGGTTQEKKDKRQKQQTPQKKSQQTPLNVQTIRAHVSFEVGQPQRANQILAEAGLGLDQHGIVLDRALDVSRVNFQRPGTYQVRATGASTDGRLQAAIVIDVNIFDYTAPVITGATRLVYDVNAQVGAHNVLNDGHIVITDNSGEAITPSVDLSGVDFSRRGSYLAYVRASDSSGNKAEDFVIGIDVLSPNGLNIDVKNQHLTYEVGTLISEDMVMAHSGVEIVGGLNTSVWSQIDIGGVDVHTPGRYVVVLNVGDNRGNKESVELTVEIVDTIAPIIQLAQTQVGYDVGAIVSEQQILLDVGVSVIDNSGVSITPIVDMSRVDNTKPGVYEAFIWAADGVGNRAFATVSVYIGYTSAPEIRARDKVTYIKGVVPSIEQFISHSGLLIVDSRGGAISPNFDLQAVDFQTLGMYTVTVSGTDASGQTTKKSIVVEIVAQPADIMRAKKEITLELGSISSLGTIISAADIRISNDEMTTGIAREPMVDISTVDVFKAGTYTAYVNLVDNNGNVLHTLPLIMHIVDTVAPVIDRALRVDYNFGASVTNAQFIQDANITVRDASGDDITPVFDLRTVNFAKSGTYTVEVRASDASGNMTTVEISVGISDIEAPVITGERSVSYKAYSTVSEEQIITDGHIIVRDNSHETIIPTVDMSHVKYDEVGTYPVAVSATDSSGNTSVLELKVEITPFAVKVESRFDRVVRTIAQGRMSSEQFLDWAGFKATTEDGKPITPSVDFSRVNWGTEGTYPVTVRVTDPDSGQVTTRNIPLTVYQRPRQIGGGCPNQELTYEIGTDLTLLKLWRDFGISFGAEPKSDLRTWTKFDIEQVDGKKVGDYPVTFDGDSNAGFRVHCDLKVHVVDTTPPTLDLDNGELEYPVGTPKTPEEVLKDAGVKITDNSGEKLTPEVNLDNVNWDKPGKYEGEVKVTDSSGNTTTKKIPIEVYDRDPPVIDGPEKQDFPAGKDLTPDDILKNLNITDNSGETKTEVDMSKVKKKPGKYPVTITTTDPSGNKTTKTIEVEIKDDTPPEIEGDDTKEYPRGKKLTPDDILKDLNIKATDDVDGPIKPKVDMSKVNPNKPGTYPVEITATDSAGNKTTKTVEITIPDDGSGDGDGDGNGGGNGNGNGGGNGNGNGNGGLGGGFGGSLAGTGSDSVIYQYILGAILTVISVKVLVRRKKIE